MNPENNKDVNKDVSYKPLDGSKLDELLEKSKGIESLWKKIKDNKDGKKSTLYGNENKLVEMVKDFIESFAGIKQQYEEQQIKLDLGKNFASKKEYENMLQRVLNDSKKVTAFKTKFPHWTIQVGKLFTDSFHFKRISTGIKGAKETTKDISTTSHFDVEKKPESERSKAKKGILHNISSFWNKYIKRGGWGKASKSKVTIELKKFGDYVNKPWRKWWELVAEKEDKLSSSEPKSRLKMALNLKNGQNKVAVLNLYNAGKNADSGKLEAQQSESILFDPNNIRSLDQKQNNFNKMFDVFSSLDKSLGNKVRELFGEEAIKEKSFLDKFKKKSSEQKPANAIETQNLNQQQQNQPANGGVNVQQPAPQQNQPQGGNEEVSAPGGKYPAIPSMNGKEKEIENILSSYGVPKDADTKAINKKSQEYKNTNNAILAIKRFVNYTGNHRAEFLVKVAECVGIKGVFVAHKKEIEYNNNDKKYIKLKITSILDKIKDLPKEYQTSYLKNGAVLLIRKIRNIIVVGLSYIASRNSMPEKEMK